ncbi:heparinase II/III family protein [Flavivirga aquimarina]|uniref:Heparinase II/III family protein n=1 Tax=Flavivirga aquimarina TaxID=2027862 RepID=A0ABT8WB12_9FLAO|nr:heparinase II/III family protein [Flavivirga aquimarina]MDO5970341.1 heparinase II/III family protein [Flavivirga aquimarina]
MTNIKQLVSVRFIIISLCFASQLIAQNIPSKKVIAVSSLSNYLRDDVKAELNKDGEVSISELAQYFREKFSERYFYNWQNFEERFKTYNTTYPNAEKGHTERALDHLAKYADSTHWKLPFNYQFGDPVNAYALRHLARQHKMVDIAYYYNYQNKNTTYLNYFKNQLKSLNDALHANKYEKIEDGNGVYEAFRSGYRILNWLKIHNMFLGEESYTDTDQLTTIATLLQHGAHLYEHNAEFHPGNHQTRGLSALAMLSILLRDFEGTDKWYQRSMDLLEEHLSKEINDDGFQFERTVHYHMSDIGNYYYVYQLAKLSELKINDFWKDKLKSLFITLTKIAYPDKSAPVLSDDTNNPWGESNDISGAITLGYLLFDSPKMGYFANNYVKPQMFWYVTDSQLNMLKNIESKPPTIKSVAFPTTGYYIMREGWKANDKMMIVSAGLDDEKPDHQHGDMLGVQAMANGKVVLPNYQVRYSLKDLELFKNSMVKNVALVDDELQGKQYTSNKGGSGFGKFRELPNPKTIAWETSKDLDVFVGSHDGFKNVGVDYSRQVIYIKDDFWIVKDNFKSHKKHTYKQVWQGHYSLEASPNLIRSTFDNASGLDIYQINKADTVTTSGQRGKQWSVVSKKDQTNFSFITILYPYKGYSNRIDEDKESPGLKGWKLNASKWKKEGEESISFSKNEASLFFSVKQLQLKDIDIKFSNAIDVFIKLGNNKLAIQSLSDKNIQMSIKGVVDSGNIEMEPGIKKEFTIK